MRWGIVWAFAFYASFPVDEVMPLLADLAEQGAYGALYFERGAFLVKDEDGIRCELWPFSGEFHRISRAPAIPRGTIAIAHTHPRCCPRISVHDRSEAERLGIPIIAISMGTLHLVGPDGASEMRRRGIRWSEHEVETQICR